MVAAKPVVETVLGRFAWASRPHHLIQLRQKKPPQCTGRHGIKLGSQNCELAEEICAIGGQFPQLSAGPISLVLL